MLITPKLIGGKFANGAVSAAFTHLFNNEARDPESVSMAGIKRRAFRYGVSAQAVVPGAGVGNMVLDGEPPIPTGIGGSFGLSHNSNAEVTGVYGDAGIEFSAGVETGRLTATVDMIHTDAGAVAYSTNAFIGLGAKLYFNQQNDVIGMGFGVGWAPGFVHKLLKLPPQTPVNIGAGVDYNLGDL